MYRMVFTTMMIFLVLVGGVGAVEKESVWKSIEEAEKAIEEMKVMGFGVTYANDTLNEAKNLFEEGYYEASELLAKKVLEIKEKAIEVDGLIDQVESKIYELESKGYNVSSVRDIFDRGLSEFMVDNYLGAEELMRRALNELDEIEVKESLERVRKGGVDPVSILLDHLWLLIILFLSVLIIGLKVRDRVNVRKWKEEVRALREEMKNVKRLIGEAQRKYFEEGSMSKMDYELVMSGYTHRLSMIKRRMSFLEEKLRCH